MYIQQEFGSLFPKVPLKILTQFLKGQQENSALALSFPHGYMILTNFSSSLAMIPFYIFINNWFT